MSKLININKQEGIKFTLFPDNQPHVNIEEIQEGEAVDVICSLTDSITIMHLLQCANAIDRQLGVKNKLVIPYLMGARMDRVMNIGDSFDLEVVANLINSMGWRKVVLFDPHSDVAPALIKNSVVVDNSVLLRSYHRKESILICPDAGASKKVKNYLLLNDNIIDVVYCTKTRDLSNGNITLKVLEPEKCKDRNCVIIDDLSDAGGTFLGIASQIQPAHLSLIVSHGIFSKGFGMLEKHFDEIITTNSYPSEKDSKIVKVLNMESTWMSI